MNLLIIDDQTSVVNGLQKGVNWRRAGVRQVFVAYNAREAKAVFAGQAVDIMLCDIEMPTENGLELYKWVRESGYDVECIFLTAHAEFDYAREAVSLKSFDYIVQPAPYEEVEAVVSRAAARVNEKRADNKIRSYGQYLLEKNDQIQNRMLGSWLSHSIDRAAYRDFAALENMISLEQEGYLVFLQIMRENVSIDQWEPSLIQFVVWNVISEWFESYAQTVLLCDRNRREYAFVIYGKSGYRMDYPGVLRQLESCRISFEECVKCSVAFYANPPVRVEEMPDVMDKMIKAGQENVSRRSAVFDLETLMPRESLSGGYVRMNMKRWENYMYQNLSAAVKEEIFQFLDHAAQQGRLTSGSLLNFHMEFNKLLFLVAEQNGIVDIHEWLKAEDGEALYKKAQDSLDDMKTFVAFVIERMRSGEFDETEQKSQLERIEAYISDHIESEISREDIAAYVHLNVDYMGRLFKKNHGVSLKEYIIEEKMRVARNLLRTTMLPVSFVAAKVGYANFSHFSRTYKKILGISPTDERKH